MARPFFAAGTGQVVADRWRRTRRFLAAPVAWIRERLRGTVWPKQEEILGSLVANRYTAVQSCHDVGKSYIAAQACCWWIDSHPLGTAVVVTTAPTNKQVKHILWKEIGRAHTRGNLPGYITQDAEWKIEIAGKVETVAFGRKPADHDTDGFQGIHEQYVLVIIDEACGVPKQLWDAIDSLATNEDARVLAIGNPDDPSSHFHKVCQPGSGWTNIRISVWDWFEVMDRYPRLRPLLVSKTWVEERRKRWGTRSPLWKSKVEGEFPDVSDNALITPAMMRAAHEADLPGVEQGQYGLDVARMGEDQTVLVRNRGGVVRVVDTLHKTSTMQTVGMVNTHLAKHRGEVPVAVDVVGVGAGVYDRLIEQRRPALEYNAGHAARNPKRFRNRRSEDYWGLRELMQAGLDDPGNPLIDLDADDDLLADQLQAMRFSIGSDSRIVVESKEDMRKRRAKENAGEGGWTSPDRADAVVMALFGHLRAGTKQSVPIANSPGSKGEGAISRGIKDEKF